jgi:hypothetical protein
VADPGCAGFRIGHHSDEVDAGWGEWRADAAQVLTRGATNAEHLFIVNSQEGRIPGRFKAGFHLDKDKSSPIVGDEIDLAPLEDNIEGKDSMTSSEEELSSGAFAPPALFFSCPGGIPGLQPPATAKETRNELDP